VLSAIEIAGEQFIGLYIVSSTFFVEILVILTVDHFCIDVVLDDKVEVRQGSSTDSIGTVDSSVDDFVPSQIVSSFQEVVTEIFPKF